MEEQTPAIYGMRDMCGICVTVVHSEMPVDSWLRVTSMAYTNLQSRVARVHTQITPLRLKVD